MTTNTYNTIDTTEIINTIKSQGIEALDLTNPEVFETLDMLKNIGEQFANKVFGK